MSSLSLLARLVVLFALLCVVAGQSNTTTVDSSSSSSSSSSVVAPSSISSSSADELSSSAISSSAAVASSSSGTSATVIIPSSSSSSVVPPTPSSSSSSSSVPAPTLLQPVIFSLSGCNSSAVNGTDLTSCDGQTGQSVITITGANFTIPVTTVTLTCVNTLTLTPTTPATNTATTITVNTPKLDKSDVNTACGLTVTNTGGLVSNSVSLQFGSYSTDVEEAWRLLGMSLMNVIIAATVVGVVVLVVLILCTLSCCCGVSLACLSCCRSRPTTVILSPQSSGYSSMA